MKKHLLSAVLLSSFLGPYPARAAGKTIAERIGYPANAKLLIIVADDVGVYHAANQASFTALSQRAVTAGSVLMTTPWLTEVVQFAKQHPEISFGVHLALCSEYDTYRWGPVAAKAEVPSLLDPTGYLYAHSSETVEKGKLAEIEREIRAQMDRALALGFKPDYIDSHQRALFSNPDTFALYMKVAHDYKLPFLIARDRATGGKYVSLVTDKDLVVDDVTVIPSSTPAEDWMGFYTRAVKAMKPGLHQIYLHMAFDDGEAEAVSINHIAYGAAWRQRDFNVVTSPEFKKVLDDNHVTLITWRDLKKAM